MHLKESPCRCRHATLPTLQRIGEAVGLVNVDQGDDAGAQCRLSLDEHVAPLVGVRQDKVKHAAGLVGNATEEERTGCL